jgi:hypothetical protein
MACLQADAGTGKTDHIGKAVGLLNRLVARTCTDPYVDAWPIARVMPWCVDCGAHLCGFRGVAGARSLVASLSVVLWHAGLDVCHVLRLCMLLLWSGHVVHVEV